MSYAALPHMGIPVHHLDLATCIETIESMVTIGRETGRSHQVVTINSDFLVQAHKHPDVHAILRSADLAVADGMPLVWSSGIRGQRLPNRIAGADLVPALATRFAHLGLRITFFGGGPGVAERAAQISRDLNPGLQIQALGGMVGPNSETDPDSLDEIRRFNPDLLCVALGHPKQERWIRRHANDLGVPVSIGVGGTFDFIAGERRRAPRVIQRTGLEWIYRMAQEPGRLTKRYATDLAIYIPKTVVELVRTRLSAGHEHGLVMLRDDPHRVVVQLRSQDTPVDHLTAAELTSLATSMNNEGRRLELVVPGPRAVKSLRQLGLDRLVPMVPLAAVGVVPTEV